MRLSLRFIFCVILLVVLPMQWSHAQRKNASYEKYIKEYKQLAIDQREKYGVPVSIKLAQALLESGAGQADLAKESNNHFGIKCHSDWKGGRVYKKDDNPKDCFRKYKSVKDSYEDHSKFLTERSRYGSLFKLSQHEYTKWAKELQKCGYATDRGYANKLIQIIETYDLYEYDIDGKTGKQEKNIPIENTIDSRPHVKPSQRVGGRDIYETHGPVYVLAESYDSFEKVAKDLDVKVKNLTKYNEVPANFPLSKGDVVYLEKKKKKASKPYYNHKVQIGESMHSISQRYGLQIKSLYKMNDKDPDYTPEEGDLLKLR